jgi:hypothetical protein
MTKSVFRIRKIAVVDVRGHEEHREPLFQALGGTHALQYLRWRLLQTPAYGKSVGPSSAVRRLLE